MNSKLFTLEDMGAISFKGVAAKEDKNGTVTLIPSGAVFPERLRVEKFKRVSNISPAKHLKSGDLLFNTGGVGTLGRSGFFEEVGGVYVPDSFVMVLRFGQKEIAPKYAFHALQSNQIKQQILRKTSGTTGITSIKPKDVLSLKILVPVDKDGAPDLHEQERVVALMDEAEALKRKRREADEKMAALKPAIFNEMFGDLVANVNEWPRSTLKEVCTIGDGNHSSNYPKASEMVAAGVPFIRAVNLKNGSVDSSDMRFITPEKHARLKKGHLKMGDVLLSNRGEIGKLAIVPSHYDGANLNSQLAWLRSGPLLLPEYLYSILSSSSYQARFKAEQQGVALQQFTISQINLIQIPIPPLAIQKEFASKVESIGRIKIEQERSAKKIGQLTSALSSQLFA